jgi:hypothetical protein
MRLPDMDGRHATNRYTFETSPVAGSTSCIIGPDQSTSTLRPGNSATYTSRSDFSAASSHRAQDDPQHRSPLNAVPGQAPSRRDRSAGQALIAQLPDELRLHPPAADRAPQRGRSGLVSDFDEFPEPGLGRRSVPG